MKGFNMAPGSALLLAGMLALPGGLGLAPAAAAQSLPPTPSDHQCEAYVNALGRQHRGEEIDAVIQGPCAAAFEREMARQHEIRRNSL